jgi:hypothetical protein
MQRALEMSMREVAEQSAAAESGQAMEEEVNTMQF